MVAEWVVLAHREGYGDVAKNNPQGNETPGCNLHAKQLWLLQVQVSIVRGIVMGRMRTGNSMKVPMPSKLASAASSLLQSWQPSRWRCHQ